MADEPDLYLQVVGFEGLHGVRRTGRRIDHITWRTEIVESENYLALDRMDRLIIRELIDLQAQGGGVVEYRVNRMRKLWGRSMDKRLAKLIVGGVVNVVKRCGSTALPRGAIAAYCGAAAIECGATAMPLLDISKAYNPQNRNMNKRGRARAADAPRTAPEEGAEVRRRDAILDTIQTAAANNSLSFAFLKCRRPDEPGSQPSESEFAELWNEVVRPGLDDDDPAKAWQPDVASG